MLTVNKSNVFPKTSMKSSRPFLSLAIKKSAKKRLSLDALSRRANCSLRNMLSSEY
jgi:hypothetical protein